MSSKEIKGLLRFRLIRNEAIPLPGQYERYFVRHPELGYLFDMNKNEPKCIKFEGSCDLKHFGYQIEHGSNVFWLVYPENILHYGQYTHAARTLFFPTEMVGGMKSFDLHFDFAREAYQATIMWLFCNRLPPDLRRKIGEMVLNSWNDPDVWFNPAIKVTKKK
jgi:hypothetical protein